VNSQQAPKQSGNNIMGLPPKVSSEYFDKAAINNLIDIKIKAQSFNRDPKTSKVVEAINNGAYKR
jgi:hypothetical protein